MQSTTQYMQQKIQPCIEQLFNYLLPNQHFKSIHDLFSAEIFHKFLMGILSSDVKIKIQDYQLMKDNQISNLTYNQMKVKNFIKIYQIIQQSYYFLGQKIKRKLSPTNIQNMVQKFNMKTLNYFIQYIFDLLKHNQDIVQFITTLPEDIQLNIMQIMGYGQSGNQYNNENENQQYNKDNQNQLKNQSKIYHHSQHNEGGVLFSHQQQLDQLQGSLIMKQQQLKQIKLNKQQIQQELQQQKQLLQKKDNQIQALKKRIQSYEQIDQLMQQKDDQILKLSSRVRQIQLRYRLKQSQIDNQNRQLKQKISILQIKDSQIQIKYQKQKQINQILNKQKQQSDLSMKKVISNLKQKNKSLNDKINDLQKQLIQINFQKQIKQKQLLSIKNSSAYQNIGNRQLINKNHDVHSDCLSSPRTPLKNQDFLDGLDSFRGNYSKLGQQLSVDFDRTQFQEDLAIISKPGENNSNKRFTQLLQQNYNLKQNLQNLQTSCTAQSKQGKQLQDEVQKLKKKITILKRRNDQIQNQRKQQVDLIVGMMDLCVTNSFKLNSNQNSNTNGKK